MKNAYLWLSVTNLEPVIGHEPALIFIHLYLEVVEKAQEEPPAKKLKVDDESDTEEPTKESPKDLDDTDGAKASKSPEVFDDDEKETLLQGEPKLNLFKNFFKMA